MIRFRLRQQTPATTHTRPIALEPLRLKAQHRPMRILDIDTESRPLHWITSDYMSQEITAMAWAWTDQPDDVTCYMLGDVDTPTMMGAFRAAYDQADMVTGHYITGHDLPLIQAMLTEYHLPLLSDTLVQDTKVHLVKRRGLSSSQENIAAMLLLEHDKVRMNQAKWRAANRLTPEGKDESRKRVIGDVQQHIEMRAKLLELGYVSRHVKWKGGASAQVEAYTP